MIEESITMLGTGNALVKHIYNTCFVLDDGKARLLVDAGGGNGILTQLDRAGISIGSLHDLYVTHAHTDHILGVIWVVRLFIQMHLAGKADGTLTVRSHQKVLDVLDYNLHAMLTAKQYAEIGKTVLYSLTDDGSTFSVGGSHFRAFDIHSTKERQLGFSCRLPSGKRLVCLGDEPFNELNRAEAEHADWLMSEAFCLYADRERFHPYEKHHSTARDAAVLAQELGAKNLILYHTEEATLATRRQCYTAEAQQFFDGKVIVPDDLEVIRL